MRRYAMVDSLPVTVDSLTLSRRERDVSSGFTRVTTTVELSGDGCIGRGEDVCYEAEDHANYPRPDLTGEWEFDGLSDAIDDADLWPDDPSQHHAPAFRQWAFESAALDLGLSQAEMTLAEALDTQAEPVRFVVSTRLDSFDRIESLLDSNPDAEFKLDPTLEWDDALLERLADLDRVRVLDLKGLYEGTEVDTEPSAEFYERVFETFPDAIVEDPAVTGETMDIVERETERVAWDYPITGVPSVQALPFEPSVLNIKPSRFGTVESLFDTLDLADRLDLTLYGGGQFELCVGRDHIQTLASVAYPDGPNDVAPGRYNDPAASGSLPRSPLDPPEGFGR
ncbi:enolase [Halosegnis longus]|uniref:enolase n=1 Tax=Halosegnis longus TaxID=2216012 RepID=UPI00096A8490|nr:enolase [Salella cibi]